MPNRVVSKVFPERAYLPNELVTTEIPIEDDLVEYTVSIDRTGLIDTGKEILRVELEISRDNGKTWIKAGGCGTHGGTQIHRFGATMVFTSFSFPLIKGTNRLLRMHLIPKGPVNLRTVDLDLFDGRPISVR